MKVEFDVFAKNYRTIHNKNIALTGEKSDYFAFLKIHKIQSWLPTFLKNNPKDILDFGCGDGFITQLLAHAYPQSSVVGIDPSPEIIQEAKNNYPSIDFYVSEKNLIHFKKKHFDVIIVSNVFHHIPFKEHTYYAQQLISLLKPNGIIIIFELNPFNPGTRYCFNTCPFDKNAQMLYPYYTKKLFKTCKKNAPIYTKYYAFFPRFLSLLRPLEPYLEWLPCAGLYASIIKNNDK